MKGREVIVTVCLLVLVAADTTRSVTVPSVTEVGGDPPDSAFARGSQH